MSRFRALIFDIDGTLVLTGGAGLRALAYALAAVSPEARYPDLPSHFCPHGKTDPLIFRELVHHYCGRDPSDSELVILKARYLERFPLEMKTTSAQYRVLPGVQRLLVHLAEQPVLLGIGTGNYEESAHQKLVPGDLHTRFSFGGYGSDSENRAGMLRAALERASLLSEEPLDPLKVLVIGDTTRDIDAARSMGMPVLAVATGPDPLERLAAADLAVPTLESEEVYRFLE